MTHDVFAPPLLTAGWLADLPCAWWIAGGWALDLWLGRVTREHHDVDIAVLRRDQRLVFDWLADGWETTYLLPAVDGPRTVPWMPGTALEPPVHQVRARRPDGAELELLLNDADGDDWLYRRDHTVRLPLERLTARPEGPPLATPEVVLLYKAADPRPPGGTLADMSIVGPTLDTAAARWLATAVATAHPRSPFLDHLGG